MTDDRIEGALRKGAGHVQDAVGGLTGDAGTQGKGKLNEAAGSVQNAYDKAVDSAEGAIEQVRGQAQDMLGEVEDYIRQQPLAAAGVAAGIGILLGMMLRGGHKTVYRDR